MSRIKKSNLYQYLADNYGIQTSIPQTMLTNFKPLDQDEFGGSLDCSLVSITAVRSYKTNFRETPEDIYPKVVKNAEKCLYTPELFGTIPVFIRKIIDKTFNVKSKFKCFKGIGFTFKDITHQIDSRNPVILSMLNDGRNYYKSHSIVVVGYLKTNQTNMLVIYDNWVKEVSFLDYNKLSRFSCINYF